VETVFSVVNADRLPESEIVRQLS